MEGGDKLEPVPVGTLDNPREFVKLVKKGWEAYPVDHVELQVRPEPFEHQKRGYLIAKSLPNCGLFFDPGLGKTLVAMAVIARRACDAEVNRVLIVAPLSVLAVWEEQFEEHAFFSCDYDLYLLDHNKVEDRNKVLRQLTKSRSPNNLFPTASGDTKLEVVVTNYDSLVKMEDDIRKWKPDMIVADESQAIKNRKALRTKCMWRLGKLASYKLILTGTPITETPLDFWAQYKFLDPNVFGKRYKDFESQYAVMGGFGGFQVKKYKNLKQLARQAYSIGYRVAKEDAIDLPPTTDMVRYCYLKKESWKIYQEMEKERLIKFLGGSSSDAPIVLTALLRMQQITGGFLKREDDTYVETGREKLDTLKEVLDEFPKGKKIVIFARFTPEIKAIKEVVKETGRSVEELSGEVKVKSRKSLRNRFQNQDDPEVLVVQIAAGGVGIDLFAADTAIFYSHDPSFSKTLQAKGRLDRVGQSGEKVTFIHLLARGTIDETIYQALQEKRDLFELVMDKYIKKEELSEMSKKHTKKQKFERKRAAPTEQEEKQMTERLKKLKNDIEETTPIEEEGGKKTVAKKKKGGKKQAVVEETVQVEDANPITVKDLADEFGITPTVLRKKLRSLKIEKPGGRWEWPEDHPDLEDIRNALAGEDEEEEKPKPKKKSKKKQPEPEPEPEEDEEEDDEDEEEEEDEDEDEDEEDDLDDVDYEEMDNAELKELCREREINLSKKPKKSEMVEKLIAWDNTKFEEDEAEEDEE